MPQFAVNIHLHGKTIDTVFHTMGQKQTIAQFLADVRESLVSHDGYDPQINVTWPKGQRVTVDSFEIRGSYPGPHGEETLCSESTRKEARERLKEYRENDTYVSGLRIVKVRERI